MELKCAYTMIVIFVFSKIAVLTSLQVKWGNFQVLHKHPGIKKCAIAALKKNDLVGGRVSKLTDLCEGLQYAQGVDQTVQRGYAYVKKIYVQENYQPPVTLSTDVTPTAAGDILPWWYWWIPGVLSAGAKVEVSVTPQPGMFFYLVASLEKLEKSGQSGLSVFTAGGMNGILLAWNTDSLSIEEMADGNLTNPGTFEIPKRFESNAKLRLSFEVLKYNFLRVLVSGEEILTYAPKYLDMITISIYKVLTKSNSIFGFEFTEA